MTSFLDEERQLTPELFRTLAAKEFPVLSDADGARMQSAILAGSGTAGQRGRRD